MCLLVQLLSYLLHANNTVDFNVGKFGDEKFFIGLQKMFQKTSLEPDEQKLFFRKVDIVS